mmetsp:Transcript_16065/g.18631  ORF Transcript_16065/g.18631 Transcript_16065/m.18631 type:complete len:108 (+) Transcript_16065:163-486(+)
MALSSHVSSSNSCFGSRMLSAISIKVRSLRQLKKRSLSLFFSGRNRMFSPMIIVVSDLIVAAFYEAKNTQYWNTQNQKCDLDPELIVCDSQLEVRNIHIDPNCCERK